MTNHTRHISAVITLTNTALEMHLRDHHLLHSAFKVLMAIFSLLYRNIYPRRGIYIHTHDEWGRERPVVEFE